ncbi:MAG: hypothetical protein ACETV1_00320 [Candidatus Bathyarchaeia archaeon]
MSIKVRLWLKALGLYGLTTHEDRLDIDREIKRRKGVYCDEAVDKGLVSEEEFREIVNAILRRRKKRKQKELEIVV